MGVVVVLHSGYGSGGGRSTWLIVVFYLFCHHRACGVLCVCVVFFVGNKVEFQFIYCTR